MHARKVAIDEKEVRFKQSWSDHSLIYGPLFSNYRW